MSHELLRLCSLHRFPSTPQGPSLLRLAQAGFFCFGNNADEVECFSCGVRRSGWQAGEDPFLVHRHLSPNCRFITSTQNSGNVPLNQSGGNTTGEGLPSLTEANVNTSPRASLNELPAIPATHVIQSAQTTMDSQHQFVLDSDGAASIQETQQGFNSTQPEVPVRHAADLAYTAETPAANNNHQQPLSGIGNILRANLQMDYLTNTTSEFVNGTSSRRPPSGEFYYKIQ